jgi:Putative auto-transporter adhesin, head GIN domain
MKRLALPIALLLAIAAAVAAAWFFLDRSFRGGGPVRGGELTSEQRILTPFTRLAVAGMADITLVQGATEGVTFESPAKQMGRVRVEVRDGTLHIENGNTGNFWGFLFGGGNRPVRATVTFRELQAVEIAGEVKLRADGWKSDKLALSISGAGTIRIAGLDTKDLAISASGAVKADVAGRATDQRLSISGAVDYRAPGLVSETARVSVSGAAKVFVNAAKTLKVSISGAGSVDYLGDPKVTQDISGMGRVKRRESARDDVPSIA